MAKLNIAVCDDFKNHRERVIEIIKDSPDYDEYCVDEFEDGIELLKVYEAGKYDIIFLDYFMKAMMGDETARNIRKMDKRVSIVFVSSEKSINVCKLDVLKQIVKPIRIQDFYNVLRMNEERQEDFQFERCHFELMSNSKHYILNIYDIMYIDKKNHKLYMVDDVINFDETLPEIPFRSAFYVSNGNIINTMHIDKLKWKCAIIENNFEVPITFKEWIKLVNIRNRCIR